MEFLLWAIVAIPENLFFYIGIKNCKPLHGIKRNTLLFLGIVLIAVITVPIKLNIYRYILSFVLFQLLICLVYKTNAHIYDVFVVSFHMLFKFIIEYTVFGIILHGNATIISVISIFILLDVLQIVFKKMHVKLYSFMISVWNSRNKFYYRYLLLMMINGLVLFIIHNLIKIKEVM